jgi:hypothetical protein
MTLNQRLQLNGLFFELIEVQSKIAYYDNRDWSPRKLYLRIEELETEIQKLTVDMAADSSFKRDSKGRFLKGWNK